LLKAEEAVTFNDQNMIEDYRLKLFLSDHGYIKKIALTSLRNAGDLKIKEDDTIVMELEGTNKSEILFFSDKANCYKIRAHELPDTKPSEYGGYLPNVLQMEENEKIVFMHITDDYKGNVLFAFENGKISKIPMAAYETKQNRKKLIHAYSDLSPIVSIHYITEDITMAAFSNLRKAIVFDTSLIPLKTTRSSQGVQVLTSKRGSVLTEVKRLEDTGFTDPEYYRIRRIPAIGYYLKEDTIEDRQITLGDL
jgi:DNA gyrase subunit A